LPQGVGKLLVGARPGGFTEEAALRVVLVL
jgi:hypothetical protein